VGKGASKGAKWLVTGGGYLEKIPLIGGVFTFAGQAVDKFSEVSGYVLGGLASLITFKALEAEPQNKIIQAQNPVMIPPRGLRPTPREEERGKKRDKAKPEEEPKREREKPPETEEERRARERAEAEEAARKRAEAEEAAKKKKGAGEPPKDEASKGERKPGDGAKAGESKPGDAAKASESKGEGKPRVAEKVQLAEGRVIRHGKLYVQGIDGNWYVDAKTKTKPGDVIETKHFEFVDDATIKAELDKAAPPKSEAGKGEAGKGEVRVGERSVVRHGRVYVEGTDGNWYVDKDGKLSQGDAIPEADKVRVKDGPVHDGLKESAKSNPTNAEIDKAIGEARAWLKDGKGSWDGSKPDAGQTKAAEALTPEDLARARQAYRAHRAEGRNNLDFLSKELVRLGNERILSNETNKAFDTALDNLRKGTAEQKAAAEALTAEDIAKARDAYRQHRAEGKNEPGFMENELTRLGTESAKAAAAEAAARAEAMRAAEEAKTGESKTGGSSETPKSTPEAKAGRGYLGKNWRAMKAIAGLEVSKVPGTSRTTAIGEWKLGQFMNAAFIYGGMERWKRGDKVVGGTMVGTGAVGAVGGTMHGVSSTYFYFNKTAAQLVKAKDFASLGKWGSRMNTLSNGSKFLGSTVNIAGGGLMVYEGVHTWANAERGEAWKYGKGGIEVAMGGGMLYGSSGMAGAGAVGSTTFIVGLPIILAAGAYDSHHEKAKSVGKDTAEKEQKLAIATRPTVNPNYASSQLANNFANGSNYRGPSTPHYKHLEIVRRLANERAKKERPEFYIEIDQSLGMPEEDPETIAKKIAWFKQQTEADINTAYDKMKLSDDGRKELADPYKRSRIMSNGMHVPFFDEYSRWTTAGERELMVELEKVRNAYEYLEQVNAGEAELGQTACYTKMATAILRPRKKR
ncbi:MAG: hypothetical protein EBV03_05175, partial [Proteobacteria bacterium]|nr:hypothetical protein [Pseudomonadota bacterium]